MAQFLAAYRGLDIAPLHRLEASFNLVCCTLHGSSFIDVTHEDIRGIKLLSSSTRSKVHLPSSKLPHFWQAPRRDDHSRRHSGACTYMVMLIASSKSPARLKMSTIQVNCSKVGIIRKFFLIVSKYTCPSFTRPA